MKYTFRLMILAVVVVIAAPAVFAGTLSGVVRTVGGPGLQGVVRIKLLHIGEPVAEEWVRTDGRFRFESVEPGNYEISVQSLGYEGVTASLNVFGNDPDIVLELRSRNLDNTSKIAGQAKQEIERALKEQKKGNRKGALDHLRKAALLGSADAKKVLDEFLQGS